MENLDPEVGDGPSGPPPVTFSPGGGPIPGVPSRSDLVRRGPLAALTDKVEQHIADRRPVLFMPVDVAENSEYVRGQPEYRLNLFGVLPNGAKVQVIIEDIDVYFDVRLPDPGAGGADPPLAQLFADRNLTVGRTEEVEGYPVRGYRAAPARWRRVFFGDLQSRRRALAAVRDAGYETASDDRSAYYRMAARNYGFVLSDWNFIRSYAVDTGTRPSPLCEHVFRVGPRSLTPLVDPMASKEAQAKGLRLKQGNPNLARDRSLVLAWDIETHSTRGLGALPLATNPGDHVFMICATVHWKDDPEPLHSVCLVDIETEPDARWTTVVCGSEDNVIRAFGQVFRQFAPDIVTGFNDGGYDWPFVIEKARQKGMLAELYNLMSAIPRPRQQDEGVLRWSVERDKKVKIAADKSQDVTFLKVPGCVPVDSRLMLRKLYPKAEKTSLNAFLSICNLESKADMPYTLMNQIYTAQDTARMRAVAHYCVVDARRCQELLVKRNVVNDCREVASLSFVSLYDTVYYAGGHKVRNLLNAYALRRGILCTDVRRERSEKKEKYPGAWVFHPVKGLYPDPTAPAVAEARAAAAAWARGECDWAELGRALDRAEFRRPVTGLDYSSLYPSLIMTYNLSPEKYVEDEAEAERLRAAGLDLHEVSFPYGGSTVRGWFVRHGNDPGAYGLYVVVLKDLFDKRAAMKKEMAVYAKVLEHMEIVQGQAIGMGFDAALAAAAAATADPLPPAVREYLDELLARPAAERRAAFDERYRLTAFLYTTLDSKQKALKVFMNTFYGEAGNELSPFFLLQLAGGVTSAGQMNLKLVAQFVADKGFRLVYGDTDSMYLMCPESSFRELDVAYARGELAPRKAVADFRGENAGMAAKEEYYTRMVEITMEELKILRDQVNAYLRQDNGTGFLRMAYEEVLFPVAFVGKKKYFGIGHVDIPNFRPKHLFIRGIETIKQGQTKLAKTIANRIMWRAVSLENEKSLFEITDEVLREAVLVDDWEFGDFIQSASYKPDKQNVKVQNFVARMRLRAAEEKAENAQRLARGEEAKKTLYVVPEAGERFQYVLVKPTVLFDLEGRKLAIKVADRMEYPEVVRAKGLEIDLSQYLKGSIVGTCARFINYADRFQPDWARGGAPLTVEEKKRQDEIAQKAAQKYLEQFLARLGGADPEAIRRQGVEYRRAFRRAAGSQAVQLYRQLGAAAEVFHGEWLDWTDFRELGNVDRVVEALAAQARRRAAAGFDGARGETLIEATLARLKIQPDGRDADGDTSRRLFASRPDQNVVAISANNRLEGRLRRQLAELIPAAGEAALMYGGALTRTVEAARRDEEPPPPPEFPPDSQTAVRAIHKAWLSLVGVYAARTHLDRLGARLSELRHRRLRVVPAPPPAEVGRAIAEGARRAAARRGPRE